jgi:hypothetical protein
MGKHSCDVARLAQSRKRMVRTRPPSPRRSFEEYRSTRGHTVEVGESTASTAINVPFAVLARKAGLCDGQRPAESPVEPGKLNACDEKLQRVDR